MKKLLAMVMAMTMLCASMGVLATDGTEETVVDPNLVYSYGWEDSELIGFYTSSGVTEGNILTVGETTLGKDETAITVTPHSGEKMLQFSGLANNNRNNMFPTRATMEWGTKYKVSFWYYATVASSPKFIVQSGGGVFTNNGYWYGLAAPAANTWTYYEVYFVTADSGETANPAITLYLETTTDKTEFYDDLRIEKAEGASISFSTAAAGITSLSTIRADAGRLGYFPPQTGYTIGGVKPQIPAIGVKTTPAETATGVINVVSQYTPVSLTEKTTLVTAVFTKKGDNIVLADVILKPCDYTATIVYDTEDPTLISYYQLETGINSQTVDMSQYEAGSYIKAFMWSSVSGLIPVSGTATLPAATVTTTPAA